MERTPTSKSRYFRNNNQEQNTESNANTSFSKIFESDSPGYIQCTQEEFENIDVTWDWNSPQSKKIPKKSQKRLALPEYPKTTIKRHLSNNSIQGFEKLQEELRLLKEEIAIPEHEESLILSPVEEAEYKFANSSDPIPNIEFENFLNESDDFFNDDLDDQLLMCTTQIEEKLKEDTPTTSHTNSNLKTSNRNNLSDVQNNAQSSHVFKQTKHITNDTFNVNESISICPGNINPPTSKNVSEKNLTHGKKEFHRTESFELSNLENFGGLPISKKEEIERKRKEALAKLEMKKKQGIPVISPTPCTSAEIEKKRQEALAKREARRQQEIIERNRQNALKRLEMTRKKNAQIVKSSLSSRLN